MQANRTAIFNLRGRSFLGRALALWDRPDAKRFIGIEIAAVLHGLYDTFAGVQSVL
ncbi:hypothetical protein [Altericista sp. CCNU0014]|uniref:hypothetical protein n=1 Tax=Altericista sp. CCNU0014 TaxID=3082949 RepID=UPI00384BB0A0